MPYSTLISCYGPKPPEFARLIGECQSAVGEMLGERFRAYDPRQVHCTIAALDRVGDSGVLNLGFHELRGQRVPMDLTGLLEYLRGLEEMNIQIGGFGEPDRPFVSRGRPPYERSFFMQEGKAVLMGWPIERSEGVAAYPPRLETLRRDLQRFGILHRYHARETDFDNDFYLRIGLYDPVDVTPELQARIEHRLRQLLADWPLVLPLRLMDLMFGQCDQQTLPPESTTLLNLSDPNVSFYSVVRLFAWDDVL
ncbi:MAG TPA: hypothetical protein VHY37_00865 [Tepidisphaeraceae bacterium]|jgi:hypothetical protein|nr:hypothetical protein [Tepidisphaeraceae bacterium]